MVNVSKISKKRLGVPPVETEASANLEKPASSNAKNELIQIRTNAEMRRDWDIAKATYGFRTNDKMARALLDAYKNQHGAY